MRHVWLGHLATAALALPSALLSQEFRASISGMITDPTGAMAYSSSQDSRQEVRVKVSDTDGAFGHTAGGTLNQPLPDVAAGARVIF